MTKPKAEHEKVGQGVGGGPKPRVLTENEIRQVEVLAQTLKIEQIAAFFGFSEPTFNRIKNRQPEVMIAYEKGIAKIVNKVGTNLIQKALAGDAVREIFFLKTRGGWKEDKSATSVTVDAEEDKKLSVSIEFGDSGIKE